VGECFFTGSASNRWAAGMVAFFVGLFVAEILDGG
jgi:hypothetical protein